MIVIAIIIVCACGVWWLRIRRYRKWFRLASRRTDIVNLRSTERGIPLLLDTNGFDLPDDVQVAGQTALLRFTIAPSVLGRLREPYVEFYHSERCYRQYFERSAAGERYLNLTPIFHRGDPTAPRRVSLHSSLLRWSADASLLVFPDPELSDLLVLAPHPDDAEIAAFGMYASHKSWVVTVTAGEKGTGNLSQSIPASARSERAATLRVSESLTVPRLGGVPPQRCANLVLPDGALRLMCREPGRPFQLACETGLHRTQLRSKNGIPELQKGDNKCTWNDLVSEIRLVLSLSRPKIVVCPHPILDTHSDHAYTAIALAQALRGLEGPHPLLMLYVVHIGGAPTYPFGPAESLVGLPPGSFDGWLADSLYSHMLPPAIRDKKYLAVAATHAVRKHGETGERMSAKGQKWLRRISARLAGMDSNPTSFLRRAPRPNEVFFVVRGESLAELLAQDPELRMALG